MIYCSLGGLCHSAQLLKINGLKKASYPFDWIFSNIKMVKHCIEDDFKTFLDKSQYSDYTTNTTLRENQCEHSIYGEMVFKGEHKVIFNHHNPLSSETDYAYLERCVDRFRELLKSEEPKTFVMFEGLDDITKYIDFGYFLNNYTNNHTLLVIQNEVSDIQNLIFYKRSGLMILRLKTISPSSGVQFQDKSDEDYLNNTLKELNII